VNAVTSFSTTPLVWIFYCGIAILLASATAAFYLIVQKLFFGTYLFGWPSLIVSIWMIGGFTIFSIGIIGIYLSKIFAETKDRPYTIVREIYQRCGAETDEDDAGRLRHTSALPPDARFR
jgi:putative glycosyltransferase